jgi:hypothetical protein
MGFSLEGGPAAGGGGGGADTDLSNLSAIGKDKIASAWVHFDGTGTPTIQDQLNVSSITDNGPGNYTVNFTVPLANVDYCVVVGKKAAGSASTNSMGGPVIPQLTTSVTVLFETSTGIDIDIEICTVLIFGGN